MSVPKPTKYAQERMTIEVDIATRNIHCELHSAQALADFKDSDYFKNFRRDDEWSHGELTTDEAQRALALGMVPEEMVAMFTEFREALTPTIVEFASQAKSTKRKRVYSEEGAELDIDRMMVSDPACWVTRKRGAKRKLVRLGISFGFAAGASAEVFARSAALGCAAADLLTKLGYAVEICGVYDCKDPDGFEGWRQTVVVPLKQSEDALDPQQVMTLGLKSTFRLFGFAAMNEALGIPNVKRDARPKTDRYAELPFDAIIGQSFEMKADGALAFDDALQGFAANIDGLMPERSKPMKSTRRTRITRGTK